MTNPTPAARLILCEPAVATREGLTETYARYQAAYQARLQAGRDVSRFLSERAFFDAYNTRALYRREIARMEAAEYTGTTGYLETSRRLAGLIWQLCGIE